MSFNKKIILVVIATALGWGFLAYKFVEVVLPILRANGVKGI